jgi:uncharacterized membrane protein
MYILALVGLLNTAHLAIQESRGFEDGCFGGAVPTLLGTSTDCGSVVESEAGRMFGVSNVIWGLLFYVTIAGGSFSLLYMDRQGAALLRAGRAVLIFLASGYSAYLVYYQVFALEQICALCMISAAVVSGLFIAQLIGLFHRPTFTFARPDAPHKRRREAKLFMGLLLLAGVLIAVELAYFKFYAEPVDPMEKLLEEEFGSFIEPSGPNKV